MFPGTSELTSIFRNVRFGEVLTPDQLAAELRPLKERPSPMATYALAAQAPNWLIDRFDPRDPRVAQQMVTYPTVDRRDILLALLLQCGSVQLRWVMQLSDPVVQRYFLDAIEHDALTMLMSVENTRQMAAIGIPLELAEPQSLRSLLEGARPSKLGTAALAQLTTLYSKAGFGKSIVEGQEVTDVLAVMVGSGTREQLVAEALARLKPGGNGDSGRSLH